MPGGTSFYVDPHRREYHFAHFEGSDITLVMSHPREYHCTDVKHFTSLISPLGYHFTVLKIFASFERINKHSQEEGRIGKQYDIILFTMLCVPVETKEIPT